MMKAAHTSDSFRASGNADNLPCNAKDLPFDLPHCCRDKTSSLQRGTAAACDKVPNSREHQEEQQEAAHHQVLNVMQTGCPRTRRPPTSSMERSTCSCTAPRIRLDMEKLSYSKLRCNCNMENCGFFPGDHIESHSMAPQCGKAAASLVGKSHSWRSSPSPARSFNDSRSTNAALQRALAAMKKVSGETDAVKKQQTPLHKGADTVNEAHLAASEGINGRCITSSDARTMSMRERGRWGNSKMQQQRSSINSYHSNQSFIAPNLSGRLDSRGISDDHHRQQLHHVQCLHCGSFSTTPVSGAAHSATSKSGRSHSFRRVRDYSWQQELQEQKKPEQQLKDVPRPPSGRGQDPQPHCEYARCPDFHAEHAPGAFPRHAAAGPVHHHSSLSWQDRYMLLCQAIAAGAFLDGGMEEEDAASRGYSWAACDCSSCEMSCGGSLRRPASHGNFSTTTSERMMELEAFSGPLGYVSESKGMGLIAEEAKRPPSSSSTRRGGRGRWWTRLPNFGKGKSERQPATPAQEGGRAGQATAQCTSCGQRVWVREEEEEEGRLCPECLGRAGSEPLPPVPQPGGRPNFTSSAAHNSHRPHINFAYKAAAGSYKHYPRRWRLMKLCRYLLGFPMQR